MYNPNQINNATHPLSVAQPEWILDEELSSKGFSFKNTRADAKFSSIDVMVNGRMINVVLTVNGEKTNLLLGSYTPVSKIPEFINNFLIKNAKMTNPECISQFERLLQVLASLVQASPETHTDSPHIHHYRAIRVSEKITQEFGDDALKQFSKMRTQISMRTYYDYLKQSNALRSESVTLLKHLPDNDRGVVNIPKLEAMLKLLNLNNNPAAWEYERFTKTTNTLVTKLINCIKENAPETKEKRLGSKC
ncbi:MAG: hypothetical protein ACHQAX_01395 [Gammaproteobacteria bacterium]